MAGKVKGVDVFEDFLMSIYHSLPRMKENNDIFCYNNETSVKIGHLFKLIDNFEFLITLVIIHNILVYLLPATWKLLSKDLA